MISALLLAPQAIDISNPSNFAHSPGILDFASARGEIAGFN